MSSDKLSAYNQKLMELHFAQSQVMRLGDELLREGGYENFHEGFVSETMDAPEDAKRINLGNTGVINDQMTKLCSLEKLFIAEKLSHNDKKWREFAKVGSYRDRLALIKAIRESTGLLLKDAVSAAAAIIEGAKI